MKATSESYLLIITLLLSLLGFLAQGAAADDSSTPAPLTVEQALHDAREKSPVLARAQAAAQETGWQRTEALGVGFLPRVSANANHYLNSKYEFLDVTLGGAPISFPQIYPETTLTFDVQLPLFDGFANVQRLKAASLNERAAGQELAHTRFRLEQDARLAFYQALAAQQLEDVAEENVRTFEDHLKEADALRKGGAATRYDVLRVQVQLSEARSDAADAHDNAAIARRKLTQLLGLENDSRKLAGTLPEPAARQVEGVQFEALPSSRADLVALSDRAEALARDQAAASLWLIPKVLADAQYSFYNNLSSSISNTDQFRSAYSVGVFLQWNLFDGGVSIAKASEVAARREQAERASEEARLQVPHDFDLWKRRFLSSSSRYEAKRLDVERSLESVRLARLEERAGSRTSTEVLDAELDLFRAKAGVVTSQIHSIEALINLESTLGRRI